MNKNWPNNLRISCKLFSNLVEPMEVDVKLERLKEFEINFKNVIYYLKNV
jgi:hypothetical protein